MAISSRKDKVAETRAIADRFARSTAAVLLDFRGVSVELITELRSRFRHAGVDYRVVKNTLVEKALAGSAVEKNPMIAKFLAGPTGIAWSYEDPSVAAKIVKAFRKEGEAQEKLTVKGAILDQQVISATRVESELATMPGKNELRASLLAQLMAPAQSLVRQLSAAGQNFAYVLDARKRQLEQQG